MHADEIKISSGIHGGGDTCRIAGFGGLYFLSTDKLVGGLLITAQGSAADALSEIYSQTDFVATINDLNDMIGEVTSGNFKPAEAMLICQAYVLNATFNTQITVARRSESILVAEYHANLALRAQNQCNRTLKTLLEFKNPKRATFIKQQNNTLNQHI